MRSDCLRGIALRLCVALLFGLLVIPGYVVVPVLFAYAESIELAGMLAGHIFYTANMGVLLISVTIAAFWIGQKDKGWKRWVLLALITLLVALNTYVVGPIILDLKAQAVGGLSSLLDDDPIRVAFGMWHGVSSGIHLFSSLLATWLLLTHSMHKMKKPKKED